MTPSFVWIDWKSNEEGKLVEVKGVPQVVSIRNISTLYLGKSFKKGFQVYVVHILDPT